MSILGIDIGLTSIKAIVFNTDGEILTSDYRQYNLLFPQPVKNLIILFGSAYKA